MKNTEIIKLLSDPEIYEINRLKPRSYRNYKADEKIDLNGEYDFYFYGNLANRKNDYKLYTENDKRVINVPSNVELSGYGDLQYVNTQYPWDGVENVNIAETPMKTNYGYVYKKTFEYKADNKSSRQVICFEGVESCFLITLNDKFIGYAKDSFTTSEFDISDYLIEGSNEIIIEVFKYSATSFLDDQDFWRLSGIFRDVYIILEREYEILDFNINYNLDYENHQVEGSIEVEKNREFPVTIKILDEIGIEVASFESTEICNFKLDAVNLWSAEIPVLYTFVLMSNETTLLEKRIGFRKIEVKNNIMLFNGKKINFKGINRHEFDSNRGRAITKEDIRLDLELLKASNFNAIRTSHYPNNTAFYDMCDEIGFYVIDEANLETHGTWSVCDVVEKDYDKILPNDNKLYYEAVKDRIINMYERDKNCTSVIIWSLGNESFGGKTLLDMNNLLIDLDSSRLCHYEGTTWDRRFDEISQIESQMYTHSESIQKQIEERQFNKPFILCEFSHAMGNSNGNYHHYLELEKDNEQYNGGFIWEYMDQSLLVEGNEYFGGDFGDYPNDYNFICDGLVGAKRQVTNELLYVKNLLSPISVRHTDGKPIIKNDNLFKSYSHLTINTFIVEDEKNILVNTKEISLASGEEVELEIVGGNSFVEISDNGKVIKCFNLNSLNVVEMKDKDNKDKVEFVDGNLNFGLHSKNFSIMFSKVHNNISQIKYEGESLFSDSTNTITPNFWRAPTNNDIGAKKHIEFSKLHNISYFYTSEIKNYDFNGEELIVIVEFKNLNFINYSTEITYTVNASGSIKITMKSTGINEVFNYGIKAILNSQIETYRFFGNGPFDSYIDRNNDMIKSYNEVNIDEQLQYLYPQEFGNKTNVDYAEVKINETKFKMKFNGYEFSLKNHSDNSLTNSTHKWSLKKEAPFMRVNSIQAGVAGDDSWGSWAKDEYRAYADQEFEFTIYR